MNIPPKYEDVVAQLELSKGREAELCRELENAEKIHQAEWLGDGGGLWFDLDSEQFTRFSTLPLYNVRVVYKSPARRLGLDAWQSGREGMRSERDGWIAKYDALQQCLTGAEYRIAYLERVMRDTLNEEDGIFIAAEFNTEYTRSSLQKHGRSIEAALKGGK